MKKIMKVCMVVTIGLAVALSGCAKEEPAGGSPDKGGSADLSAAGVFPIVKNKITLKVMIPANSQVEDFATNAFTKYLEEKTNIHIEWDIAPSKSSAEKLNLVLAGGDLPDVIMGFGITPAQQMIYGEQGIFIPLNEMIEKYGKESKRMFQEMPIIKDTITAPDGKIYALPAPNECFHCSLPQKMWIYKPWLDKLNLKMPTTTEEYYEVLKAFKTKDPNGNGKADEIPLSSTPGGIESFLMNAFTYYPSGGLYLDNGKVTVSYNKPEWKEGLTFLRKLYVEGLVDPQSLTQDGDQLLRLGENPDVPILGSAPGLWQGGFSEAYGKSGRWLQYTSVPPVKGPKGLQVAPYYPYQVGSGIYVITKASKHPEEAFRLADMIYDQEMTLRSIMGEPDKDWKWADKSEVGINGKPAIWKQLANWGEIQNSHWAQTGPSFRTNDHRLGEVNNPEKPLEPMLYKETKEKYEPYKQKLENILPPLYFTNEQASELADLSKTINDYVKEMTARFVTGDANLDKGWDEYMKTLDNMSLKRFLEIYQETYDAKMKNK